MNIEPSRDDAYLWDRSDPVDAEIAALERVLAAQAWTVSARRATGPAPLGAMRTRPVRARHRHRNAWLGIAAVLALAALGIHGWYVHRLQWPASAPWEITSVEGQVHVDGSVPGPSASLKPGDVLATGPDSIARLRVARIGEMVIGGDSRFVVTETRDGRHRTRLESGTLWARIWAPPGSFAVATTAGQLIDLGCEFVIHAGPGGSGSLTVRSGWVLVDNAWREVLVPEGARVEFDARGQPGIPYDLGASPAFVDALKRLNADGARAAADGADAHALVAASRPADAISLLTLLRNHPHLAEGPLFDRIVAVMPADAHVTRAAVRAQGGRALDPWWNALPYPRMKRWWLKWPDAFGATADSRELLEDNRRRR